MNSVSAMHLAVFCKIVFLKKNGSCFNTCLAMSYWQYVFEWRSCLIIGKCSLFVIMFVKSDICWGKRNKFANSNSLCRIILLWHVFWVWRNCFVILQVAFVVIASLQRQNSDCKSFLSVHVFILHDLCVTIHYRLTVPITATVFKDRQSSKRFLVTPKSAFLSTNCYSLWCMPKV